MKRWLYSMLFVLFAASAQAQTLPLTVKVGVDPDPTGNTMGYTVQLDAGAPIDVGMPAVNPSCKDFVGSKLGSCVPFTVTVTTAGIHTVKVVAYDLSGSSPNGTVLTFPVSAPPGDPGNLRLAK